MSKRAASSDSKTDDEISSSGESSDESVNLDTSEHSSSDEDFSESEEESNEETDDLSSVRAWCEIDLNNMCTAPPAFPFTATPGVNININQNSAPITYFEIFFDDHLISILVNETNKYARQEISKQRRNSRYSKAKKWEDVNEEEMRVFIGILLLQGVIYLPKQEWYWSKRESIQIPIFSKVMSRDRFRNIMKYWHFSDNSIFNPDTHPCPKLRKLYEVVEYIRIKFGEVLTPEKHISVDESLLLFKGRLGWKQYIPIKRARFGIKSFVLCESESGYIWNFLLYVGKNTPYMNKYNDYPMSTKTVLHLMDHLLGKGYCVTVDNFYMSPQLSDYLIQCKTDIYGTLRSNRKDLPKDFGKTKLKKGEIKAYQRGKVMALKWQDKKTIYTLSTVHNPSTCIVKVRRGDEVVKPQLICDYNNTMGGVDRSDQELSYYESTRKQQKKYYKKVFRHLLDKCLFNAFVIFKKSTTNKVKTFLEFRMDVIEGIFEKYLHTTCRQVQGDRSTTRLIERHFISHIPPNPIKKEPRRRCAICCSKKGTDGKKIRKETRTWCKDCNVGLCMEPCFKVYHTQKNF